MASLCTCMLLILQGIFKIQVLLKFKKKKREEKKENGKEKVYKTC